MRPIHHIRQRLIDAGHACRKNLWGAYLASAILSAAASSLIYSYLDLPQTYTQLIVGNLAWAPDDKFHDYALLFSLVISFFVFFVILSLLLARLTRIFGDAAAEQYHDFTILLSAPAGYWVFGLLTTKTTSLLPVYFSSALLLLAMLFGFVLSLKKEAFWGKADGDQITLSTQELLILLFCTVSAVAALAVTGSRAIPLLHLPHLLRGADVLKASYLSIAILVAGTIVFILTSQSSAKFRTVVRNSILFLQLTFPAFFLILIPSPWLVDSKQMVGYPITAWVWALIGVCVAGSYVSLFRCYRQSHKAPKAPLNVISWACALGVILFLKIPLFGIPSVPGDDYHFGEFLTPWWSWAQHGLIPLWDYAPPRGLMNYFQGAAASLFFDGTAASYSVATPFVYLTILWIAFPVISRSIGKGTTIVAFLTTPYLYGISEIDVLVTVFICYSCQRFFAASPIRWLAIMLISGLGIVLYAPGQGGLAVLAMSPLAAVMAYHLYRDFRRLQTASIAIFLGVLGLLCVFTPLGKMELGAVRYAVEQAEVNSIANGISWNHSFTVTDGNPLLFQATRACWLVVTIIAGLLILKLSGEESRPSRSVLLAYAVPIFILTFLFILRAAGRIDGVGPSRLGVASIWICSFLLPIFLFSGQWIKPWGRIVLVWVAFSGSISTYFVGVQPPGDFYSGRFDPVVVDSAQMAAMAATKAKFPRIGAAVSEEVHIKRLQGIREVLDHVLDKNETYLDVTNRAAQYFYLDRKQPIESGAVYNLVAEAQQLRAIDTLKKIKPAAILISADNMLHDGGTAGLRSYLLYRYLMLLPNYKVVEIGEEVWLIRDDRLNRLEGLNIKAQGPINDAFDSPLNRIYRLMDLRGIPVAWGHSSRSLSKVLHTVHELSDSKFSVFMNSMAALGNDRYQITGEDPSITFDIYDLHMNGRDFGLVSFDFTCERGTGPEPRMELYWSSKGLTPSELTVSRFPGIDGTLIVPMDATPSWLLTNGIHGIRFDVFDKNSCRTVTIKNVRFLQRNAVAQM